MAETEESVHRGRWLCCGGAGLCSAWFKVEGGYLYPGVFAGSQLLMGDLVLITIFYSISSFLFSPFSPIISHPSFFHMLLFLFPLTLFSSSLLHSSLRHFPFNSCFASFCIFLLSFALKACRGYPRLGRGAGPVLGSVNPCMPAFLGQPLGAFQF